MALNIRCSYMINNFLLRIDFLKNSQFCWLALNPFEERKHTLDIYVLS